MRIAIILNGIARKKKQFISHLLPILKRNWSVDLFETHSENDAVRYANQIRKEKYDLVLAAGGDGTLNQVLNGLLASDHEFETLPVLGVIPIGSGNDFARSVHIKDNVDQIVKLIQDFKHKKIDLGKIHFLTSKKNHFFINEADVGMGPEVVKKVSVGSKSLGAAVAYYKAILSTFKNYKPIIVHASSPQWQWHGKIRTLAVANGKFFGHGLCIAPNALVDDGISSIFIVEDASIFDFIRFSGKLKKGKKISFQKVHYLETTSIKLDADSACTIEADGELVGQLPVEIELLPQKIKFLC